MEDLIDFIIITILYLSTVRVLYVFEKQKYVKDIMEEYKCSYKRAENYYEEENMFILFLKSLFWIFWLPILFISNLILKLVNKYG